MQQFKIKLQQSQLLTEPEMESLANSAISLLSQEPNLLELRAPLFLVGDIHGQFYDFLQMINITIPPNSPILFLGDYVDRGYHSVETISYLLVLKCLNPRSITLLRGNHETSSLTRTYGFYDQVNKKYGNPSVWHKLIEVFSYLPLAAVIDNSVLGLHGGLSPSLPLLDQLHQIARVSDIPESGPMCDLVWSDPDLSSKEGWSVNSRGAGFVFSRQVVEQFLHLNGLQMVVRAHQLAEEGHCYNFGEKWFVTVWSAPNYCYRCGNQASVLQLKTPDDYQFLEFEASPETSKRKVHFENLLPYFL